MLNDRSGSESESSFNWVKTPQLTKRSCDLQMDLHNNKDRNAKTITKKQGQLLLLGSRSFITVFRKENVRQSSEGPWVEEWKCEHVDASYGRMIF